MNSFLRQALIIRKNFEIGQVLDKFALGCLEAQIGTALTKNYQQGWDDRGKKDVKAVVDYDYKDPVFCGESEWEQATKAIKEVKL